MNRDDSPESPPAHSGEHTSGNLFKSVLTLGIPMTLEMLLLSAYSLVDLFFVRQLGRSAVAAVGAAGSLFVLAIAFSIGLTIAAGAIVARRMGERDIPAANIALFNSMLLAVIAGVIVGLVGVMTSEWAMTILGVSDEAVALGAAYLDIRYLALPVGFLLFGNNGVFRAAGEPKSAMMVLAVSNVINMIIDPILIFGWGPIPAMGVEGSALATFGSQSLGLVYQFWALRRGLGALKFTRSMVKIQIDVIKRMLAIAAEAVPQNIVRMASHLLLTALVARQGEVVLAGFVAAIRVHMFAILPAFGFGNSVATLVGQNLGAKEPDRATKATWIGAGLASTYMIILAGLFLWQGEWILSFIAPDAEALVQAYLALKFLCYTYIFVGVSTALESAFNGAGVPRVPLFLSLICRWGIQLGLASYFTFYTERGPEALWFSVNMGDLATALLATFLFMRGSWKQKSV